MTTKKIILCVEDEDDLRGDIAEELEAANYRVLQAANGSEALSLLEKHRPDLVLCDITMPGLGVYDVLKALREQGTMADVPFIFLTALAERNDVLSGKQAGADDYLVKPIDYEILLATVAARLDQVSASRRAPCIAPRNLGRKFSSPRRDPRSMPFTRQPSRSTGSWSAW